MESKDLTVLLTKAVEPREHRDTRLELLAGLEALPLMAFVDRDLACPDPAPPLADPERFVGGHPDHPGLGVLDAVEPGSEAPEAEHRLLRGLLGGAGIAETPACDTQRQCMDFRPCPSIGAMQARFPGDEPEFR